MNQITSTIFVLVLATFAMAQQQHGQLSGGGGFNRHGNGGGSIGYQHPNGASGGVSYGHQRGWGHDVGVQAMVPIWKSQNERTTILGGGGVNHHFGGPLGSKHTGHNVGLGLIHRF